MRILIFLCIYILLVSSCAGTKIVSSQRIPTENLGVSRAISLATDGMAGYLLVPMVDGKYAITTNFALCGVIIDGAFDGHQCAKEINQFYESEKVLDLSDIMDAAYFDLIDVDLLKLYVASGPQILVNEMYDKNCIPINEGNLSHFSTKAAALVFMGVDLVETQYNNFELSTSACELYRK